MKQIVEDVRQMASALIWPCVNPTIHALVSIIIKGY